MKVALVLILLSLVTLVIAAGQREIDQPCKLDAVIVIKTDSPMIKPVDEHGEVVGGFGLGDKPSITIKIKQVR